MPTPRVQGRAGSPPAPAPGTGEQNPGGTGPPGALTEDDEEPDDKSHNSKDQAPVADGLIVWGGGEASGCQRGQAAGLGRGGTLPAAPGCTGHTLTVAEPVRALLGHLLWKREIKVRAKAWVLGSRWAPG